MKTEYQKLLKKILKKRTNKLIYKLYINAYAINILYFIIINLKFS